MGRAGRYAVPLGAAVVAVVIVRHRRGRGVVGRKVPGGILIGDAAVYDALSHRLLLGSLYGRVASDIGELAPEGARVLEVGCGPGRLSIRLAGQHGLEVTGLDLDPAMIERARANAGRPGNGEEHRPSFLVGDVASLAFPDGSFDLVVSTLSMHRWAHPAAGLAEIARVLRPEGRALIWDLRPRIVPFHRHVPGPVEPVQGSPLRVVSTSAWRWPWRLPLTERIELVRAAD